MFVMPLQCEAFGGVLPAIGTRVVYAVGTDPKTGGPRAEDVHPEAVPVSKALPEPRGLITPSRRPQLEHVEMPRNVGPGAWQVDEQRTGTMARHNSEGRFGFIQQDSGEDDIFVMPRQCVGFGGMLPPIGARVAYGVAVDPKTGGLRAEEVQLEAEVVPQTARVPVVVPAIKTQAPTQVQAQASSSFAGEMARHCSDGRFGFIRQDSGEDDMFVLPLQCVGFGGELPPIGARVLYSVAVDPKTGGLRAEEILPEAEVVPQSGPVQVIMPPTLALAQAQAQAQAEAQTQAQAGQLLAGEMARHCSDGRFGFVRQDSGEEDMFVLPHQCVGFGGELPPIGVRVVYGVGIDPKTMRPRAEDVQPEEWAPPSASKPAWEEQAPTKASVPQWQEHVVQEASSNLHSGTMARQKEDGRFGFIQQDSGEPDMFVMPLQCGAFGGLPPVGTRVVYSVGVDPKTFGPRAENVQPEEDLESLQAHSPGNEASASPALSESGDAAQCEWFTGTMNRERSEGRFGFISQDNGGDDMFVMPLQCEAFGNKLPPLGTLVVYTLGVDPKTGGPRAENVQPGG
mmetsp:Transcript_49360/g.138238  ORF Transcript_49360/g.138238 Transcript_49360/m.138238 type:complete len:567 (-) Transcript_49360:63-1763(-)